MQIRSSSKLLIHNTQNKRKETNKTKEKEKTYRHKGRIERLRVLLAYGFEARTQHQLSSSRRDGRTPPHNNFTHAQVHNDTDHQPKGDINVVWFHIESNCLDHNEFVHHLAVAACVRAAAAAAAWWVGSLRGCCYTRAPWSSGRVTMALVVAACVQEQAGRCTPQCELSCSSVVIGLFRLTGN